MFKVGDRVKSENSGKGTIISIKENTMEVKFDNEPKAWHPWHYSDDGKACNIQCSKFWIKKI